MLRAGLVLVCVVMSAAAVNLSPVTVVPADEKAAGAAVPAPARHSGGSPVLLTGQLDTIGGTTYDWQSSGPMYRFLVNSPDYGVHALWMYSAEMTGTAFSDRNMRYNFYEYAVGDWNWVDPDFMQSGQNVFPYRVGFGNLAVDPNTGCAVVSCHSTHGGLTIHPDLARDIAPGAGIFEYAEGDPTASGYQWPPLAVGQSGTIHVLSITAAYLIQYFRVSSWPTFETGVGGFVPDPGFPSQYIAASPVSQKVVAAWENENITPNVGWYRVSTDDGVTWGDPQQFDPPAAFGGDTVTTFHISSMNPYYDRNDRLHFLTAVSPIVRDTGYIIPAEIWHWCGENTPAWSKIHRATCDPANLQAAVGYNALYADRPTVCETDQGALIVAWEQFDSANVEPTTSFLRADIFLASSVDNGTTWSPPYKLTDAQTTSCRFPCMVDAMPPDDDMWLSYEIDQVAGFYIQSQGAATTNPIVVWHGQPDAIVEQAPARPTALGLSGPGVVRGDVTLRCMLPRAGHVSLDLFDAAGRPVARPLVGYRQAGDHTVRWDAGRVPSGVYLARLSDGRRVVSRKLTVVN